MLENVGRNVNRYRPLWYPQSSSAGTKPRFRLEGEELVLVPQPFASQEQLIAAVRDGSVIERIAEHEYWLERPSVPTGRLSSFARLLCANSAIQARKPDRIWSDASGEPFRVTVAVLEAFHREALASGARTAPVLIFPTREALISRCADEPRFWEGMRRELEQRGVPYLDLTDPLAEYARREHGGDANPLYTDKNHLTGPANEVVAVALQERLTAEQP